MEDLDFSNPGGPLRSAPKPQPPVYVPAIARSFFESAGREQALAAGTVFFERVRNTAAALG
jgi:hypothetical protein